MKRLVLFHHDPGRSDDAVDAILATAREDAARRAPGLEVLAAHDAAGRLVLARERLEPDAVGLALLHFQRRHAPPPPDLQRIPEGAEIT